MIASKDDFLFQLRNELSRIGIEEQEDIIADFEEHFKASAGVGISEEETCRKLGDVKEIARNYLDFRSSRINSMVAREVEAERPRVSLTKPGQSVPADLSLKNEEQPIREYTPEHNSEEIYPNANGEAAPLPSYTPRHISAEEIPEGTQSTQSAQNAQNSQSAQSTQNAQNTQSAADQTLGGALGAAGKALADAAVTAGHAVADAFSREEVRNAGRSMADAMKNAGHAAAEAVKSAAEQAKSEHEARQAQHEDRAAQDIPRPVENPSRYNSEGGVSENYFGAKADNSEKSDNIFSDIKGMKMNPNAGKLFGQILMDVLLWSWLLAMLIGIDISIYSGGAALVVGAVSALFGASGLGFISSLFLTVFLGSLGLIIILLGVLLTKGIIGIVKNIVIGHVKALYDL